MSEPKKVLITMGSKSDRHTMKHARDLLEELGITHDSLITSAHRTPKLMAAVAQNAHINGFKVIIAGAGGSAHLPGMSSAETVLPVIAVAVQSKTSVIFDIAAIFSNIAMPGGVPLIFAGFAKPGATNAALCAARILALSDKELEGRLIAWIEKQAKESGERPDYDAPD